MGHKAIVVINKSGSQDAEPARVLNETFDCLSNSARRIVKRTSPFFYAQATAGKAGLTPDLGPDLQPLFDAILREIPAPQGLTRCRL